MTMPDRRHLRCGRAVDDAIAQVAEGRAAERDGHQQHCPHCQAALAEYERLWAPLHDLAAQQVTAPEHLLETAMRRIRGTVEHADYGVIDSPLGATRISARVVVVISRETAETVPGVRVALSKHLPESDGTDPDGTEPGASVSAGVAGRSAAITITLAVHYGHDLRALGERVRQQVADRIRALTGLEPVAITVVIDDVLT